MQLTNEVGHRALHFVASVVDQGYHPTAEELERYIDNPEPFGPTSMLHTLHRTYQAITERYQRAMGFHPGKTTLEALLRLGWLTGALEEGRVDITALGRAVLRALNQQEIESDIALQVTLDPTDPLAYAKVIGRIAQQGDALLVDPYFKLDHLLHIVQQTSVQRILVGEQLPQPDRAQLAAAISTLDLERPFEIRMAKSADMHDRFLIPESGPVETMGTSLTGVGKKFTVMQSISPPAADNIRDTYLKIWTNAELLADRSSNESDS